MTMTRNLPDFMNEMRELMERLGANPASWTNGCMSDRSAVTGEELTKIPLTPMAGAQQSLKRAEAAFLQWRIVPAPKRGELVRLLGEELRSAKRDLGRLISIEVGKIESEGLGEVQEMIDICDFAVGLSRQLYGLTIATERADHRMMENWHPLGVVGIITAFNFPTAVWAWNAALALVCGNSIVWKPSEKAPLCAIATQAIFERAVRRFVKAEGIIVDDLSAIIMGGRDLGELIANSPIVQLVSATGSTAMGREVGPRVAARFGRVLLELGGNNAAIICPSADLDLALRAVAFGAMGTGGQRCTTLRRLFVHESIYDQFVPRLRKAFASVAVGNPLVEGNLVGPLIDKGAFDSMQAALERARAAGASISGGERIETEFVDAYYVRPALAEVASQIGPMKQETFAPILYVTRYSDLGEAIRLQNAVAQGLSSAIFTLDMREAEQFLSVQGSDCGIANVNIGTSGAEIGGAFGGEKETGGGRESGSDSWRAYMRRQTNTINYGRDLPLAQGVKFDIA
jgi:aldehyde dehydrogenase (NAD+)